eukprot:COSAG01_NODE_3725_length_5760_cov_46.275746_5_plen_696_part_00
MLLYIAMTEGGGGYAVPRGPARQTPNALLTGVATAAMSIYGDPEVAVSLSAPGKVPSKIGTGELLAKAKENKFSILVGFNILFVLIVLLHHSGSDDSSGLTGAHTSPTGEDMTTLELYVSSARWANTNDHIFVTFHGELGNTAELQVTDGSLTARETFSKPLCHADIGPIERLTLRISGNDGVHLDEVRITTGSQELLWLLGGSRQYAHNGWLDGDGVSNGQITLEATAASNKLSMAADNTVLVEISTVTGQRADRTGQDISMIVFGSGGHFTVASLPAHDFSAEGQQSSQISLPSEIGSFKAVKLYNTGPDGWILDELQMQMNPPYGIRRMWPYGLYIDGNFGPSTPSTEMFYDSEAVVLAPGNAATLVTLETGSLNHAGTGNHVGVYLQLYTPTRIAVTSGTVNTTSGLQPRSLNRVTIQHPDSYTLQAVVLQLYGNDGVHFSEIRVNSGIGGQHEVEYAWPLSELNGWLDGPNDPIYGVPAIRSYQVATSIPAISIGANSPTQRVVINTLTNATSRWSESRSTFLISFFFRSGHVPPQVLSHGFRAGDATDYIFDLPANAQLWAVKILNTGNDGWKLDRLTISPSLSPSVVINYNGWIDGDGSSARTPKSEIFYMDGSWASQGHLSPTEVQRVCPDPYRQCTGACQTELQQALADWTRQTGGGAPRFQTPQMQVLFTCMTSVIEGTPVNGGR